LFCTLYGFSPLDSLDALDALSRKKKRHLAEKPTKKPIG
jgi:hypothetical protein